MMSQLLQFDSIGIMAELPILVNIIIMIYGSGSLLFFIQLICPDIYNFLLSNSLQRAHVVYHLKPMPS